MLTDFSVIQLPRTFEPNSKYQAILAQKYKSLRLESLKTDPESFASSYEQEVAFTDDVWSDRLKNPLARSFIALDLRDVPQTNSEAHSDSTVALPWVGITVLLGPRIFMGDIPTANTSPWKLFYGAQAETIEESESIEPMTRMYVINAVWIKPDARGRGIAKRLMDEVIKVAQQDFENQTGPDDTGLCMCFVEKENTAATRLYKACGFGEIAEEQYASADGRKGVAITLRRDITVRNKA